MARIRHVVWLASDAFGWEKFEYASKRAAEAALDRLSDQALKQRNIDGIDRSVTYERLTEAEYQARSY